MADFYIVKGDRLPKIKANPLRNPDGTACNVSAASVTFEWAPVGQTPGTPSSGSCTIINGAGGIVEYQFGANAFPTAGLYHGRFKANWSGVTMSFPNKDALVLDVTEAL